MKPEIIWNDEHYKECLNSPGSGLYNFPCTIRISKKVKFYLGLGNTDDVTVRVRKNLIYVVGVNKAHSYISMHVIDKTYLSIEQVFIGNGDLDENSSCVGILEKNTIQQIKILSEYL